MEDADEEVSRVSARKRAGYIPIPISPSSRDKLIAFCILSLQNGLLTASAPIFINLYLMIILLTPITDDSNIRLLIYIQMAIAALGAFIKNYIKVKLENFQQVKMKRTKDVVVALRTLSLLRIVIFIFIFLASAFCVLAIHMGRFVLTNLAMEKFTYLTTQYKLSLEIRKVVDGIQAEYQCCGSTGSKSWKRVDWIPDKDKAERGDDFWGVPPSCCDARSSDTCEYLVSESGAPQGIYQSSCVEAVTSPLRAAFMLLNIYWIVDSIIGFTLWVAYEYFVTSAVNAVNWKASLKYTGFGSIIGDMSTERFLRLKAGENIASSSTIVSPGSSKPDESFDNQSNEGEPLLRKSGAPERTEESS